MQTRSRVPSNPAKTRIARRDQLFKSFVRRDETRRDGKNKIFLNKDFFILSFYTKENRINLLN